VRGVIVILALASAGCAMFEPPPDQWTKPGSLNGDLAVQLYVCEQWSRSAENLHDCMAAHGWTQTASNP
jgi:hypothetical protein